MSQSRVSMASLAVAVTLMTARGMVPRQTSFTSSTTSRMGSLIQLNASAPSRRSKSAAKKIAFDSTSTILPEVVSQPPRAGRKRTRREQQVFQEKRMQADEDDDDEYEYLFSEVDSFQELQRSTGSEILDYQLQNEIDKASPTPDSFLDNHIADASYMEKVAMTNVPEQLPQPAINAFRHQRNSSRTKQQQKQQRKGQQEPKAKARTAKTTSKRSNLEFSSAQKVTPQEEIELAKMIQRGVWLHKLKTDREASENRSISKSEWAKLANLESPTQLRREVATYRRAKQLLVSANMGLVHTVVKKNYYDVRKRSGTTYEELVQEGSLGLLRAAELFDPSRGIRFSTYATIWIKGTLSKSSTLDGAIKLPLREKTKWNKIVKAHQELVKEKGGADFDDNTMSTVSVEEIANRLDMTVEDVVAFQRKMKQAKSVLSLDYEYQQQSKSGGDGSKGGSLLDTDLNMQADVDLAERAQMQADVIAAMARNLTPREARLMRLRYGLTTDGQTRTIEECAEAMGVSRARASQLAKACLKKLREASEAESLEEYLLTIA